MLLVTCIHGLLKERITEDFLVMAEPVLKRFVLLVARLYGVQHVTFNIHQLTHIVDSVRQWGPLWATSAFPFEGNNQVLLGLFHGKTHAPQQITEKFSLKMGIKYAAPEIMSRASERAKHLYSRLSHSGRYLPVNEKTISGVYLYGKAITKVLSILSRAALERELGHQIPVQMEFSHYLRFSDGRFMCHASTYDRSKKRRNDIVILSDNTLCLVKELVIFKRDCLCDVAACNCELYPYVILKKLQVKDTAFFTYQRLRITCSEILEVQGTAETIAKRVQVLRQKCVAVQRGNKLFSVPIPNRFETD
jgi:hypothetical protein